VPARFVDPLLGCSVADHPVVDLLECYLGFERSRPAPEHPAAEENLGLAETAVAPEHILVVPEELPVFGCVHSFSLNTPPRLWQLPERSFSLLLDRTCVRISVLCVRWRTMHVQKPPCEDGVSLVVERLLVGVAPLFVLVDWMKLVWGMTC